MFVTEHETTTKFNVLHHRVLKLSDTYYTWMAGERESSLFFGEIRMIIKYNIKGTVRT